MKVYFLVLLFPLFGACTSNNEQAIAGEGMLSKEIQLRLGELQTLKDTLLLLNIAPEAIHARFEELLLLSKDRENLQASVNLSNKYLNDLCAKHRFNSSALTQLNLDMTSTEISYLLKQNELNILNQVILQKMNRSVNLESAH